ncbi:MAG: hypothetical protein J6S27_00690, partial [Thermoguttaceae bacterium]|nr:hypothetical protein [Thermoguttaceae bacterium]
KAADSPNFPREGKEQLERFFGFSPKFFKTGRLLVPRARGRSRRAVDFFHANNKIVVSGKSAFRPK